MVISQLRELEGEQDLRGRRNLRWKEGVFGNSEPIPGKLLKGASFPTGRFCWAGLVKTLEAGVCKANESRES